MSAEISDALPAPAAPSTRYQLTISYDGATWLGWQSQSNHRGVQDRLEQAMAKIVGAPVSVQGSGRTDAGVHAHAQIAHADVPTSRALTPESWVRALNTFLPASIRVLRCQPTEPDFHARFSARGKVYRYRIVRGEVLSPFDVGRAWRLHGALDLDLLRVCAQRLVGRHNFVRLAAHRGDEKAKRRLGNPVATTRTITRVSVIENPDDASELHLEFEGEGFLYKMVRLLVGSMIHVAQGRESMPWFNELLTDPTGPKSHHCAPADGLYLVRVIYLT